MSRILDGIRKFITAEERAKLIAYMSGGPQTVEAWNEVRVIVLVPDFLMTVLTAVVAAEPGMVRQDGTYDVPNGLQVARGLRKASQTAKKVGVQGPPRGGGTKAQAGMGG